MTYRIAIDVDGVLRSFTKSVANVASEYGIDVPDSPQNWGYLFNIPHRDKTLGNYVFGEYAEQVFGEAPVIEGAKQAYDKFKRNPHLNIYIVTTQSEDNQQYTLDWLKKNGFEYDKIYFLRNKLKAPAQVLIDDKVDNVKKFADNARLGILVDASYNQNEEFSRRVENLEQAYQLVNEFL